MKYNNIIGDNVRCLKFGITRALTSCHLKFIMKNKYLTNYVFISTELFFREGKLDHTKDTINRVEVSACLQIDMQTLMCLPSVSYTALNPFKHSE